MSGIKLITPPDRIYTTEYSFLLIYHSKIVKEQLQTLLIDTSESINVYLYEPEKEHEIEWLLDVFYQVDTVILDIDNCDTRIRELASYFLSKDKTYWLTNGQDSFYNVISKNRVFDLDFLKHKIGENFEAPTAKK
jgi:hypothetical protein